jgi:hypothetical protein
MISISPSGQELKTTSLTASRPHPPGEAFRSSVDPAGVEPALSARQADVLPLDDEPITAVDRRGVAPRFPPCDSGVFLFDQQPISFQRSRRESNPDFRHTRAACRLEHLKTVTQ